MQTVKWIAFVAAGLALACAKAPDRAQAEAPAAVRLTGRCGDVVGYLRDPSPGGREVHASPDARSPVLGRIAPPAPERSGGWPVGFRLHEARDGWLLVEDAGDDTVLTESPARPMYSGRGWIRGNGVYVGIQASQAFAEPRFASDIVLQVLEPHDLESLGGMTDLVACEGNWVRGRWTIHEPQGVRYEASAVVSRQPLVVEAWATGICNLQETSCDQPPGDRPKPGSGS
ncbi:MAG TPA: hypothetical protein VJT67_12695 [Longimicrobiaceae bacterium]|nr:hypothetical protein [Longimicrobiaceae bacterium]